MTDRSVNQGADQSTGGASSQTHETRRGPSRKTNSGSRAFSRLLDAEVEFLRGLADSASSGLHAFGDRLPKRHEAASADWTRSIVTGLAEASVVFLEDASKVVRRTSDILLEEDDEQATNTE